jgi:DNA repair photolyase
MIIQGINAKSILTKSNLPEADYCINPYVGCAHQCVYCYARFMRRFTSHTDPWGTFVDVKVNAVELIKKKSKLLHEQTGTVILGSVTDAYQPLEKKYELTRGILKELQDTNLTVSILTKSSLVTRDIDLLKKIKNVKVGITITTMDDHIRRMIEPGASSVDKKIEALKMLHSNGIKTYVFIGPIIPQVTNIEEIFSSVKGYTDEIWGEILNVRCGNYDDVKMCLEKNFKDTVPFFESNIKNEKYWDGVEEEFRGLCKKYNIPMIGFYRH